MKKTWISFFAGAPLFVLTICALIVLTATDTAAQRRTRYNQVSKAQVDRIIARVEQRTDTFINQFDRALDNSRLDGTQRENNLNQRARDLEAATDELRREFDRRDRWNENRAEVQRCLNIASDINVAMRNRRLNRQTENNWANLRAELNALAQAYRLPNIGNLYR